MHTLPCHDAAAPAASAALPQQPAFTPLDLQRRLARLYGRGPARLLLLVDECHSAGRGAAPDAVTRLIAETIRLGRKTRIALDPPPRWTTWPLPPLPGLTR